MPYEINGIELIETTVSNGFVIFTYIFASIMIVFALICIIEVLIREVFTDKCSEIISIIGLILGIMLMVCLIVFATQNGTITHYTVKISDEITMQDFLEFQSHYDIVETHGEYFIITER